MTSLYRLILLVAAVGIIAGKEYLRNNLSVDEVDEPAAKKPCKKATDCGNGGCCLRGWCSYTGGTFMVCYSKVKHNGNIRPVRIWRKTDVCPCEYGSYCDVQKPYKKHPKYGKIGSCFPIMG